MHRLNTAACFTTLSILATLANTLPSNSQTINGICRSYIGDTIRAIEEKYHGKLSKESYAIVDQREPGGWGAVSPFPDATKSIVFSFETNMSRGAPLKNPIANKQQSTANANLMNSANILKSLSANLIKNCREVSQVIFNLYEWNSSFSINTDGKISKDKCLDRSSGRKPYWGEAYCGD